MDEGIYRKESLERINSPEQLHKYMHITNPPLWIALIAVVILLVGAVFWATFYQVETVINGIVISENGEAYCVIMANEVDEVKPGTFVRVNEKEYNVTNIEEEPVPAGKVLSTYLLEKMNIQASDEVYILNLENATEEGKYQAEVVVESISPITFLFDSSK